MDDATFKRKSDFEEYELYFHARAHYISAEYYETLDRRLTYFKAVCAAFGAAFGGKAILSWSSRDQQSNSNPRTAAMLCLASFGTAAYAQLYSTQQDPAAKKKLHNSAASRMKALQKKVRAWGDTIPEAVTGERRGVLLNEYKEFIDEHQRIEEDFIKSEDWAFPRVHDTMSKGWIDKGKALQMYFPERNRWYYFQRYVVKPAEPIVLTVGSVAVSLAVLRFMSR